MKKKINATHAKHILAHQQIAVTRLRLLTEKMLDALDATIAMDDPAKTDTECLALSSDAKRWERMWGPKESHLSTLIKLTQIMLKLLPAEQAIYALDAKKTGQVIKRTPDMNHEPVWSLNDLVLLDKFVQNRRKELQSTNA